MGQSGLNSNPSRKFESCSSPFANCKAHRGLDGTDPTSWPIKSDSHKFGDRYRDEGIKRCS